MSPVPMSTLRLGSLLGRQSRVWTKPLGTAYRPLHTSLSRQSTAPAAKAQEELGNTASGPVDRLHGSYHWDYERLLALSLIPLTATIAIQGSGNPTTDLILGVLMPLHCHVGFDACIVDYLPKRKMPKIYAFSIWALRLSTIGVLYGCYEFNTNDIGLTELVTRAWTGKTASQ